MVRIITDSAADFEPQELAALNLSCIPIAVILGDDQYEENVNLTKDQFFELLKSTGESPKTAQPAPSYLMDFFADAKKDGEEAIYISLSSALSGTYQTAVMTQEDADYDGCHVLDSLSATGGQRLVVEYACRLRDEGKSAAEILERVSAIRDKIVLYACIDTLEYLYRGGRISQTVYKLGTMAQVKPIIRVTEEGAIEVPAKALGMRKGMDMLCKRVEQQKPSKDHNFYVMYTADRTIGETLAQKFRDMGIEVPDDRIIQVGPSIGSHIGPNACGVVYVEE